MEENSTVLKFSELWQEAIAGHCFGSYDFLLRCHSHLEPAWFQDPSVSEIMRQLFDVYTTLKDKRVVTQAELAGMFAIKHPDIATQRMYSNKITKCVASSGHVGLDLLSDQLTEWIKLLKMKMALEEAAVKFNSGKYDQVSSWVKQKMTEVDQASFKPDDSVQFNDPLAFIAKKEKEENDCLTIGHPDFDELLLKGAKIPFSATSDVHNLSTMTKGGLARGNSTLLMGPSNSGKTTTVVTVVVANVYMKKHVLYIPLEQQPSEIMAKLYSSMTGLNGREMSFADGNEAYTSHLNGAAWFFRTYLTLYPFIKPGQMYVENLVSLINLKQEERKAKYGVGYDLLIVDYPKKLKSEIYKYKTTSDHAEVAYVYQQFMDLANFHQFHALLPVQTNREGFKVNRGDGNRLLDMGDIASSYDVVTNADNVITINRGPDDVAAKRIKFHIAKCRRCEAGWTFVSRTDMERSQTHAHALSSMIMAPGEDSAISEQMLTQQLADKH